VISKDGTIVHLRDKGRILRDEAGHPVRVIGSTRDVSLEHDLAEKAALAQKMAAVGKLTGGIAHEFNNLLTVVMGNAEALLDELSPQDPKFGAVDLVAQAARKGAQLTNRLLAFASRQSLDPEIVDPNDVIAETMGLIKRLYSPEMEIVSQLADDLWPIYTDATQLQTALLNLVLNSQEAMPEGGSLWVQTENVVIKRDGVPFVAGATAGDYVAISVRDCGVGMPDEVIKKAFDPFFTTKGSTRNSGLGLSSVYGFVKQSNGFIRIDSVAGKGTTVTLYFPRSELLQPDTSAIDRPAGPSPERILVVEDDPMVLEFAVAQIASLGYCLEKATSGRQALAFFEKGERFDLLLTDIVMPGMDGVQLAERAEQLQPGLRVLYASGYNEKAGFASLKTDKPFRLLQKPYTRRHLAKKIREIFMSS
jgi:signal transduction histidine kinase/CheY-like chemotaxis protein